MMRWNGQSGSVSPWNRRKEPDQNRGPSPQERWVGLVRRVEPYRRCRRRVTSDSTFAWWTTTACPRPSTFLTGCAVASPGVRSEEAQPIAGGVQSVEPVLPAEPGKPRVVTCGDKRAVVFERHRSEIGRGRNSGEATNYAASRINQLRKSSSASQVAFSHAATRWRSLLAGANPT